jgi:nucleotide-binding universal stress UspA family protein
MAQVVLFPGKSEGNKAARALEPNMIRLGEVLVATDLGSTSQATVDYARSIAAALSAHLHIVHVVGDLAARAASAPALAADLGRVQTELESDARRELDAIAAGAGKVVGGVTTAVLTARRPAPAILAYARDAHADLIVVGTRAQQGVADMFMGSVAQELVRHAKCPVLTLRHVEALRSGQPAEGVSRGAA